MNSDLITVAPTSSGGAAEEVLPLTWAQENMWDAAWGYGPDAHRLNLRNNIQLPRPVPLAEVIESLAGLGARYDILRTTFDFDGRRQVIHRRVEVPVVLASSSDLGSGGLAKLASEVSADGFDYADAAPWRVALECDGGNVHSAVLVVSHLAFDAVGAWLLSQLLLDAVPGGASTKVASTQARDLVRCEASDEFRSRSDRALACWAKALAPLPPGCGIRRPAPGSYSVTVLESAAVAVAAQTIAVRASVSTGCVIAAALSRALLRCLPLPPSLLLTISGNRHYPDLARYLGLALQNAYFVIPKEDSGGFDDYARRCFTAAMAGIDSARYDTYQFRTEQFAAYARGTAPDLSFFFNDVRAGRSGWGGLERLAGRLGSIAGSADEPEPAQVHQWHMQDSTFFFTLAEAGHRCSMTVMSDDQVIQPAVTADILNYVRDLLVTAAVSGSAD